MRRSFPTGTRLFHLWTLELLLLLCSILCNSPARAASLTEYGSEDEPEYGFKDEVDYGTSDAAVGDESQIIMSISFRGSGLVPEPPDFQWRSNGHLWTEVMRFVYEHPAFSPSARGGVTPLLSAAHLFQSVIKNARETQRFSSSLPDDSAELYEFVTKQYSAANLNSSDPNGLIEVPLYAPGVQHAMFLLVARNSTLQDVTQAARSFVSTHPVFGFDSSPADSVERKMAYVLTMIDLRKSIVHHSSGFSSWANEIYRQFEPLKLAERTGRKVFLDLGSRRGEYFSHFHKFWYFEGFEWILFECNNRRIAELAQLVEMFQERGVKVDFVDEAAWIENTTLAFHLDDDEDNADHGSSLFSDHAMVHEDGMQVDVPALNFSDFLLRNFRAEDTIIMRVDIEGAEYEVLKSLIVTGAARLVDYIDVEWHAMLSPSLHHLKQADTVLPWLLEGFGTQVKGSDYYFEVECSSEDKGAAKVCHNTKYLKGKKAAAGDTAAVDRSG